MSRISKVIEAIVREGGEIYIKENSEMELEVSVWIKEYGNRRNTFEDETSKRMFDEYLDQILMQMYCDLTGKDLKIG
jgi:predicted component of type VI protein secretion system